MGGACRGQPGGGGRSPLHGHTGTCASCPLHAGLGSNFPACVWLQVSKHFPDTSQLIISTCMGGSRGPRAAEALRRAGYRSVVVLEGGVRGWEAAGLPLVRQAAALRSEL